MALKTGGTTATTSLSGFLWNPSSLQADIAAFNAGVKLQINPAKPILPGALIMGVVDFPERPNSQIALLPGDWVFFDTNGWPIVVSSQSIAAAPWVHS